MNLRNFCKIFKNHRNINVYISCYAIKLKKRRIDTQHDSPFYILMLPLKFYIYTAVTGDAGHRISVT